jgi:hypothetical protein
MQKLAGHVLKLHCGDRLTNGLHGLMEMTLIDVWLLAHQAQCRLQVPRGTVEVADQRVTRIIQESLEALQIVGCGQQMVLKVCRH